MSFIEMFCCLRHTYQVTWRDAPVCRFHER